MCKYIRALHVCGHPRYMLKHSCSHSLPTTPSTTTHTHTCSLLPATSPPPRSSISETITQHSPCGTCTYTPSSDPFLSPPRTRPPSTPRTPLATRYRGSLGAVSSSEVRRESRRGYGVPVFDTPQSLDVVGRSLYEELLPYRVDVEFLAAAEDDVVVRRRTVRSGMGVEEVGEMDVGRGVVEGGRYRKYLRLTVPPRVVGVGEFYRKRKRECGDVGGEEEVVRRLKRMGIVGSE